ncbi:MAG: PAS domain S-box protein [Candidatus Thermoplasmatota archaeon]|nr:PAS domain S-box protein [Candidatus Thermoplasmatota archaeon]
MTKKNIRSIEESILTQSNTLFFIIDDTGKITYESPSIHQSKIFSKKVVNTSIYELFPKKDQQKLKNNIQQIIKDPTHPTYCTVNLKNKTKQKWKITAKNLLDHTTIKGILLSLSKINEIETSTKKNQKNKTIQKEKQKRIELESILEEKKEQYQMLVNHANEGICVAQDGIIKFVNPKLCKLLDDTKENILFKPFIDFIHPDDQALVSNRYKNRLEGKSVPEDYLFRTVDNSGNIHWVQIHAAIFTWEDKPATVNFINEVTEKIFTKQKFEKLLDSAPVLIAEFDAETLSLIYVNNAFANSIGIPADELIGKKAKEFFTKKTFEQRVSIAKTAIKENQIIKSSDERNGRYFYNIFIPLELPNGKHHLFVIAQDITDIRLVEQKYHRLIDSSPDAIAEIDGETEKIVTVNPAMAKNFNVAKEHLIGKDWKSLLSPEVYKERYEVGLKALNENKIQQFEDQREDKYFQNIFVPLQTDQGSRNLQVISRDITKQKQIQKELEYNQQYLDNIINTIGDPVFVKDRNHNWILLNDAYCKFMGYDRKDLIGKSDYEFFPKQEADIFWEKDEEAFKTGIENINEEKFTDKKGIVHTIQTRKKSYLDKNKEKILVGIIHDITDLKKIENELRESEEKFRAITTSAQDAIIIIDKHGKINLWNNSAERIFGYKKQEVIGESIHTLLMPEKYDFNKVIEGFKGFKKDGSGPVIGKTQELVAKKKNGEQLSVELSLSSIELKGAWHAVGIVRDITERKEMENSLRDAKKHLEQRVKDRTKNLEQALNRLTESEKRYKSLIETAPIGIGITDFKGRILDVNSGMKKITGFSLDDFDPSYHYVNKKDRNHLVELVKEKGSVRKYEIELRRKNGETYFALLDVEPIEYMGESLFLIIEQDITLVKEAEQRLKEVYDFLRNVINSASEFIFTLDENKKVTMWNKTAEKITGISTTKAVGKKVTDLSCIANPQVLIDYLKNICKGYVPSETDLIIKSKKGTNRILRLSCSRLLSVHKSSRGFLIVGYDVTKSQEMKGEIVQGSGYLQYKSAVSTLENFIIDLKLQHQPILLISRSPSDLLNQKTKQMDIDVLYLDDQKDDEYHIFSNEAVFKKVRNYCDSVENAMVIIDRIDYLMMTSSFETVLHLIYRLMSLIVRKKAVLIVQINSSIFSKKQLSLLKEELILFEESSVEDISLEQTLYEMLSFIYEQNQKNVVVSYGSVAKKFSISKVTNGKRVAELERKGLVSISLKGRMKSIQVTKKGEDLLQQRLIE